MPSPLLRRSIQAVRARAAFAGDLARALLVLLPVEHGRRRSEPGALLAAMRARGRTRRPRSDRCGAGLARAIGWVDRISPGGPNCLRRTLLRVALDPRAAREPVVFGLNVHLRNERGGVTAEGHAWVESTEASGRFDVEFRV